MDKKDIYEHLANIYLDASLNRKKQNKQNRGLKNLLFSGAIVILSFGLFSLFFLHRSNPDKSSQLSLVLTHELVKINFNFDPAKKEIYSLNFNKLNLNRYKELGFSLKKSNYKDTISLRIEFSNAFNERSSLYVKDIPSKWKDYRINLSEFNTISDWSEISSLSFIAEEWNAKDKKDVVYIDNLRVIG